MSILRIPCFILLWAFILLLPLAFLYSMMECHRSPAFSEHYQGISFWGSGLAAVLYFVGAVAQLTRCIISLWHRQYGKAAILLVQALVLGLLGTALLWVWTFHFAGVSTNPPG